MDKSSTAVCYAFLEKSSPEQRRALLKHLTAEQIEAFRALHPFQGELTSGVAPLEDELNKAHYSWFTPFLRSLPQGDIKLFLGCLTEHQQKGLKASLLFSNQIPQLSDLGKLFLQRQLFSSLAPQEELLPIACLPAAPINALLVLNYHELISLIALLSMHDLAVEIRQIIDTTKLKRIYGILTQPQITFLKTLIYHKEPVIFKKLELNKWDGHTETLTSALEQRGINRLAKALYPEERSLLWYIAHRLDTDRGSSLIKLCVPLDHPRAAILLSEQVFSLIQSIKNQEGL